MRRPRYACMNVLISLVFRQQLENTHILHQQAQESWATFEAANARIFSGRWKGVVMSLHPTTVGEASPTKSLSEERLGWAARKWTLLGLPVAYIKVAPNLCKLGVMYIRNRGMELCERCDESKIEDESKLTEKGNPVRADGVVIIRPELRPGLTGIISFVGVQNMQTCSPFR